MRPRLKDGWLVIDYDGADSATIHIATGTVENWQPAFRDFGEDGQRVVQIRPPADVDGRVLVWLRVNGAVTGPGAMTL